MFNKHNYYSFSGDQIVLTNQDKSSRKENQMLQILQKVIIVFLNIFKLKHFFTVGIGCKVS